MANKDFVNFFVTEIENALHRNDKNPLNPQKEWSREKGGFCKEDSESKKQTTVKEISPTPYKTQVGGTHYKTSIQPVHFIKANGLNFNEGNVVKYIARHKAKNGIEDLKKVIQYTLFEAYEEYPDEYNSLIKGIKDMIA